MAKKHNGGILALVFIIIVIALIAVIMVPQSDEAPTTVDNGSVTTTVDADGNEVVVNTMKNFEYLMPEDWYRYDNAIEDIQSLGEGQSISFGVIEDPIQDGIVYFASYNYYEENDEIILSVYKYNELNYTFDRLFRNTYGKNFLEQDLPWGPDMHIVGYDSGNLIVLVQDVDDSPGPCALPLLFKNSEYRQFYSMNLDSPYSGFEKYEIPKDVMTQAETEYTACMNENFLEAELSQ